MAARVQWLQVQSGQVHLIGELDRDSLLDFWAKRDSLIPAEQACEIDLRQLTRIDSAGLAFLMTLLVEASEKGSICTLVNIPSALVTLIDLSNLTKIMSPYINTPEPKQTTHLV
ncbi:MAG: STAS domain-containing protein [Plesiomonas sp.]|uniref:STAS domain-containing protein n=1 Tax=Plesiomonas sp. TaxID=2486279 RepID=UPI003F370A67